MEGITMNEEKDNLYGVLCRLGTDSRDNTTGYALLISGDGHYGIAELKRRVPVKQLSGFLAAF